MDVDMKGKWNDEPSNDFVFGFLSGWVTGVVTVGVLGWFFFAKITGG